MTTTNAVGGGSQTSSGQSRLMGKLTIWAAIGLSVGLMAPSMAANINPQGAEPSVGRAIPLAFLIAAVGILLVSYSIARLCQHFHHAGSVYGFVGATLGARPGVVAGWGLVGTYMFYAVTTTIAAGIFGTSLLQTLKIWTAPPTWAPFVLAGVFMVMIGLLASSPVKRATTALLSFEGATVALILLVSVVVLIKLVGGHAPGGHTFTMSVFSLPHGASTSRLFQGAVFGFLSFAGFEASATLGEETAHPRRDIHRHRRHRPVRRRLLRLRHGHRGHGLRDFGSRHVDLLRHWFAARRLGHAVPVCLGRRPGDLRDRRERLLVRLGVRRGVVADAVLDRP